MHQHHNLRSKARHHIRTSAYRSMTVQRFNAFCIAGTFFQYTNLTCLVVPESGNAFINFYKPWEVHTKDKKIIIRLYKPLSLTPNIRVPPSLLRKAQTYFPTTSLRCFSSLPCASLNSSNRVSLPIRCPRTYGASRESRGQVTCLKCAWTVKWLKFVYTVLPFSDCFTRACCNIKKPYVRQFTGQQAYKERETMRFDEIVPSHRPPTFPAARCTGTIRFQFLYLAVYGNN